MWKSGKKAGSTKKKESTALWKNAAVFPREKKKEKLSTCVSNFSTGNVEKGDCEFRFHEETACVIASRFENRRGNPFSPTDLDGFPRRCAPRNDNFRVTS